MKTDFFKFSRTIIVATLTTLILGACGMQGNHGTTAPGQQGASMSVNLGWSAVAGQQQGFYVEESSDDASFTQVATVPDGINTTNIAVPSAGTYYFRVRSYNQAGTSPYTPVVTAQVQ